MDIQIINLWEKNKDNLKDFIRNTSKYEYNTYKSLVKLIVDKIINTDNSKESIKYDSSNITVIDDGDFQGTQIFIIPAKVYQPLPTEYLVTYANYMSCELCDLLQGIIYSNEEDYLNEQQINDIMTLCLHLVQRMKKLYELVNI